MNEADESQTPAQYSPATHSERHESTPPSGSRSRLRRVGAVALMALVWLAIAVGAVLLGAALWIRRTFGVISVEQMLMNLPTGDGGAGGGSGLLGEFVVQVLVVPLGIVVVALVVFLTLSRPGSTRARYAATGALHRLRAQTSRLFSNRWLSRALGGVLAFGMILVGGGAFAKILSLPQYLISATTDQTMSDYYVAPAVMGSEQPKNLVLIYLEGIENTFADETLFEKNMLEPIQKATEGWSSIEALRQYEGGGWTMSGIVSTQCGVPLRSSASAVDPDTWNEIGGDVEGGYLSGATCLGDVLSEQGYHSVFLGGADASFSSKGNFLQQHGYDEVKDLTYWEEQGETEIRTDWGLSDRRLLENAKEELRALYEADEPFNLTLLTLDSHEMPWVHDYCEVDTEVEMTSIISCSMQLVADFISFMEEEGYLEDTVVWIMGDHQKMAAAGVSFWDELKNLDDRTIFSRVWSPDGAVDFGRSSIDQLSVYATMLDVLGFATDDHRAGVGVSAMLTVAEPGSILDLNEGKYAEVIGSRSIDLYRTLWAVEDNVLVEAGAE